MGQEGSTEPEEECGTESMGHTASHVPHPPVVTQLPCLPPPWAGAAGGWLVRGCGTVAGVLRAATSGGY